MVAPSAGSVVLVKFPFSDLSSAKLRPAVVLTPAGLNDWILCQITSNPYADPKAVRLEEADFIRGSLKRVSFARPGKLFTANASIMVAEVGHLNASRFGRLLEEVVSLFSPEDA